MDVDWDLLTKPEEPKPSWYDTYNQEEEMQKWAENQAAQEYEYRARSEWEKRDAALWAAVTRWENHGSVEAGILLYLLHGDWL